MLFRVFLGIVMLSVFSFGYQYQKEKYVRSNTTSACPLYNMHVVESWECGDAFDSDNNPRERYCGAVKVFRYSRGSKASACFYEGYVGTFPFNNIVKRDKIIRKYKNKMW